MIAAQLITVFIGILVLLYLGSEIHDSWARRDWRGLVLPCLSLPIVALTVAVGVTA